MKKSPLEIYALAVCFVTFVCFVIALGFGTYDIIRIMKPEFTLNSYQYEKHQSNEDFRSYLDQQFIDHKAKDVSEEEITKMRLHSYQEQLRIEKRKATQRLTKALIIMLIDAFFFFIHWRIAKRARLSAAADTA